MSNKYIKELELRIKELEKANRELKKEAVEKTIVVNTAIGKVKAGLLTEPNWPGIYIDLNRTEDNDYENGIQSELDLNGVTVEYDAEEDDFIIRVWRKDKEDYIHRVNWSK